MTRSMPFPSCACSMVPGPGPLFIPGMFIRALSSLFPPGGGVRRMSLPCYRSCLSLSPSVSLRASAEVGVCAYICVCAYVRVWVHVYARVSVCMCVCVCVCLSTCIWV